MFVATSVRRWRRAFAVIAAWFGIASALAGPPQIPTAPGVTFVLAVANTASPQEPTSTKNVLQGDYEVVVTIGSVGADGIGYTAFMDGFDAAGVHHRGAIPRTVRAADLGRAHLQIFGFHTDDAAVVGGATSLGPSLAQVQELGTSGKTEYAFRNFANQPTVSGTLTRSEPSLVDFPMLINGKRVTLPSIRATGQMALGTTTRPFETFILDHPTHPLSLRVAYGPRNGTHPFTPDFAREIVRIKFPVAHDTSALAESFQRDCRAEVSGIYFDFNQATLKPQSNESLLEIVSVLAAEPQRKVSIEGHTDNIGTDTYNDDLSARRAAAVKAALVRDFGIDAARLSTAGHGERQPIESNDTLAGRARNRRVELVCAAPA